MATSTEVRLSHPDKVMYPAAHFTKKQVASYYLSIAPVLLPHLHGRPITLKRYPDGVAGPYFYERRCPTYHPGCISTANVHSSEHAEGVNHCVINDAESLLWIVNLASLELHTLLSTQAHTDRPTQIIFDLDPGEPAGLLQCALVALKLKVLFDSLKLVSVIKTSGGKGLHLAVPLNTPVTFEATKSFARVVAQLMETNMPKLAVAKMQKSLRIGKVLVDWSRNENHKTTVAPYSLRAQPTPTVSTPLAWKELEAFAAKRNAPPPRFEAKDIPGRLKRYGDLYAPILKLKQKLPHLNARSELRP
jgi:bifunctional non-homologous end joining protein LigD